MSLSTIIQTCFGTLLDEIIISETTGKKAISIIQQHFTFTAHEITKGYQDSYGYTISAITVGLAAPDQKLAFVQKILHSKIKITREFADPIEINYFQPFAQKRGVPNEKWSALRKQLIDQLNLRRKFFHYLPKKLPSKIFDGSFFITYRKNFRRRSSGCQMLLGKS